MTIKTWNENRRDAQIETSISGANNITCGGLLGTGKFVRGQQVTCVKK